MTKDTRAEKTNRELLLEIHQRQQEVVIPKMEEHGVRITRLEVAYFLGALAMLGGCWALLEKLF
jgi:hypothetical protein